MLEVYLPVAQLSVDVWALWLAGLGVGILSGMFGVGGGFLITPLLIFWGIPPQVAVASGANQIVGNSVSAGIAHMRQGNVDMRMGCLILVGGFVGSYYGVSFFLYLKEQGQIDFVISLIYVLFLAVIGLMMMWEVLRSSVRFLFRRKKSATEPVKEADNPWPLKIHFKVSNMRISIIPPLILGVGVGGLSAMLGVGGGFILVPAMIYMLGMPTLVVVGTSLFYTTFLASYVTLLHATTTKTVDIVLVVILVTGGVIGAQIGSYLGKVLKGGIMMRLIFALLLIGVSVRLLMNIVEAPFDPYTVSHAGAGS
ncbi:MAG: sulfite exporter TauE/SafE family protein [Alphaproteobacteria bacterium GM7ARS4]|nr:sulfite exporter TauE/SafE family protein [Alphaproteobacteria bacterium GM7ARS4]